MRIEEFVAKFRNHPVLFIGSGIGLRYLENSYTWPDLLSHVSEQLTGTNELYLDAKSACYIGGQYRYDMVGSILAEEFDRVAKADRDGKFKSVNDQFYMSTEADVQVSRFKLYIAQLLSDPVIKEDRQEEIAELKKVRKNIGSIITTNYDRLIEDIFEFSPLVGNDILLSNPYGTLYKIHGCVSEPSKIIITEEDYAYFEKKYELIRAQLLSLFIHNPIIFLGYSITDRNIREILKTIFTYVDKDSVEATKIKENFLLVEYDEGSNNTLVSDHDIQMDGFTTIRINKLKTDNYIALYKALSTLHLPISAMDVRKVQSVVKEIYAGGDIKVIMTEDPDQLRNEDKVLVIGSNKTVHYVYHSAGELMSRYFSIIDEHNEQILGLVDKIIIQSTQYFPIFGFSKIHTSLESFDRLKKQQIHKLKTIKDGMKHSCRNVHSTIKCISGDTTIPDSSKTDAIFWGILERNIDQREVERFLRDYSDKQTTSYRKLLTAYDFVKYGDGLTLESVPDAISSEA